jgi:hypothetical protein
MSLDFTSKDRYLHCEISSVGISRSQKASNGGILGADLNIKDTASPFHSVNGDSIWTQLGRKTGIQIKRIISEPIAGKPVRENLQESAVTGQEAKGGVRASVQSEEIACFFRELVEWKTELAINFYRKKGGVHMERFRREGRKRRRILGLIARQHRWQSWNMSSQVHQRRCE